MASGRERGADDQIVPQQKKVVNDGDTSSSSGNKKPLTSSDHVHTANTICTIAAKRRSLTDDHTVPTAFSSQPTQPNGGFCKGNRLVLGAEISTSTRCYKTTSSTDMALDKFW